MQLLNSSVVFFPGEWCSPGLATAAAMGLQQKALSGRTAADGSTVQMFNLTLAVQIRNTSADTPGERLRGTRFPASNTLAGGDALSCKLCRVGQLARYENPSPPGVPEAPARRRASSFVWVQKEPMPAS